MKIQGLDRRILKAFYTQYVSVLLIVLVFFVTAFQTKTDMNVQQLDSHKLISESSIGDLRISQLFNGDGSLNEKSAELEALVNLLNSHDLRADLFLTVPALDFEGREPSFLEAVRRADALAQFFRTREIPLSAFRFTILRDAERASEDISVKLISEEEEYD